MFFKSEKISVKKQVIVSFFLVFSLIIVLGLTKYFQISSAIQEAESRTLPPEAITSYKVEEVTWPVTYSAIGSLSPVRGAVLSAEESGRISKVNFMSGQSVKSGSILVELDVSVERQQLAGALAELDLAELNAKRQRALREKNSNSILDLDNAEAKLRLAQAEVKKIEAIIARRKIIAPFDGQTGIRMVNEGQTVSQGAEVVSLHNSEDLFVDFSLPQQSLSLISVGAVFNFDVDTYPGVNFVGNVSAVEPQVDMKTRNIHVQGVVSNKEDKLKPGMFVNVTLNLSATEKVLPIPESSVNYAPYGNSVYILTKVRDKKGNETLEVRPQVVKLGRRRGDLIAVMSGLNSGDEIASSGIFKLRPGVSVVVNNSITPGAEILPKPTDT